MVIICVKLFSDSTMHNTVMGRTQTGFTEVYAQSLSADCDLDLRASDRVLVRDTSSLAKLFLNPTLHSKFIGRT